MTLSSENKCLQDKKLKFVQHRFQSSFLLVRFLGILSSSLFFLWQDFIYLFLEWGERREREGKKHQPVASHTPLTRALACNPGMYPDQESNQWPFSLWGDTWPPEPHWSGRVFQVLSTTLSPGSRKCSKPVGERSPVQQGLNHSWGLT